MPSRSPERLSRSFELLTLTRKDAGELPAKTTVLLPVGAIEQHGDHLPLGTDTLIVARVAQAAARMAGDSDGPFAVMPTLQYGRSDNHRGFPGVVALRSVTLLAVLEDIVRSLARWGLNRIFVLNGHGGNDAPIRTVLADVPVEAEVTVGGASYWTIARDALEAEGLVAALGWVPGHAGSFETSLMLAIDGVLVGDTPTKPKTVPSLFQEGIRWRAWSMSSTARGLETAG